MVTEVTDDAAIDFSSVFYRALAEQPDIKRAVEQSRTNLQARFPKDASNPKYRSGDPEKLTHRCPDDMPGPNSGAVLCE